MRRQRGFTLIELLIVVAKAQADTRALASAVSIYAAHCGGLPDNSSSATTCPSALNQSGALPAVLMMQQTNAQNAAAGPFLNALPTLPAGWTGSGASYLYSSDAAGAFRICASGDSTVAASPGGTTCH